MFVVVVIAAIASNHAAYHRRKGKCNDTSAKTSAALLITKILSGTRSETVELSLHINSWSSKANLHGILDLLSF
jgi:hypothetical protein